MAKNTNPPASQNRPVTQAPAAAVKSTPPRNSPLPKAEPRREISHEMIAKRAYEIHVSGKGGSQYDNWIRAERELKGI